MTLFRSVNEKICDLAVSHDQSPEQPLAFICECSRIGCMESVYVPPSVYEQVREDPTTFLVLPGHDDPDVEEALVCLHEYAIVRSRTDVGAEIAQSTSAG
jgi:hypothetical protein